MVCCGGRRSSPRSEKALIGLTGCVEGNGGQRGGEEGGKGGKRRQPVMRGERVASCGRRRPGGRTDSPSTSRPTSQPSFSHPTYTNAHR